MDIILYVVCGIAFLLSVILSLRLGNAVKFLAISSALGLACLLLFVFLGSNIGLRVNLNAVTVLLSLTGGIPGAIFAAVIGMFI